MNLDEAKAKIIKMFGLVSEMAQATFKGYKQDDINLLDGVLKKEQKVNNFEKEITPLLVDLSKKSKESEKVKNLFLVVSDTERMGDHLEDIVERIEIKIREGLGFSSEAQSELDNLFQIINETLGDSIKACENNDSGLAKKVVEKKSSVDKLVEEYRQHHIDRLTRGVCDYRSGMVFSDTIGILGGICKHSCRVVEMWMS